jgi:hypothetical protein
MILPDAQRLLSRRAGSAVVEAPPKLKLLQVLSAVGFERTAFRIDRTVQNESITM